MKRILFAFLLISSGQIANAEEKETVCAKYFTNHGWSKSYKVEASILKGLDLMRFASEPWYKASSGFSTFVVIVWDKDQESIIEMSWPTLSTIGQDGKDQRGVRWNISINNICL